MNFRSILKCSCFAIMAFVLTAYPTISFSQGLHASGKKIVDQNNNEIILRGMGLGGWMLQEPYMMEMGGFAGTQWQIKAKIAALIGESNTQAFYDAWHQNHCTRRDIDSLAAWGFNSVRLPMHYNLFTLPIDQEPVSGENTWLDKGFAMTDSLLAWCKANNMYLILDLHAAPGGQGKDAAISDYDPAKLSLWESTANKNKTIALWRKLAERYVNEPWIGAYDLINEPNWSFTAGGNQNGCSESSNAPLRQLYIDITNAIRAVDTKHLIIIEGNCWGNNYNGMFPLWDNNMALSFHKYWSNNDQGSISGIVSLRNQYNVPIWLGESGENSNAWFTDAISLVEGNGIGWAWWPMKKINSIVNPLTIKKTTAYQTLLNYWNSGGTAPSVSFAFNALMEMAQNSNIANCIYRKDVTDAMFRQIADTNTLAYKKHIVPGVIPAPEFDMGNNNIAYFDTDVADYHVTTGTSTTWNKGYAFRNDGVDVQTSSDTDTGTNGYNVGFTADNEWLMYSFEADSTAAYTIALRYAALLSGTKVRIYIDDAEASGSLALPSSGGYQTWVDYSLNGLVLDKGIHKMKVYFEKGGANFSLIKLHISGLTTSVECIPIAAETWKQTEEIRLSVNKKLDGTTINSSDFSCSVNGSPVAISSLTTDQGNPSILKITLSSAIYDIDVITISYNGNSTKATDGTLLQTFNDLPVRNNLPVYTIIPGKLEAEAFSVNNGLVLENTTDAGGGQNIGYTNAGDFLEYRVRVTKTAKYSLEVRIASAGTQGKIEIQQLDASGNVLNTSTLTIPVTGGWQSWKSIGTFIDLNEGVGILKVKILQPEFNINWFKFTETSLGVPDESTKVFTVFPNPAHDSFNIIIPGSEAKIKKLRLLSSDQRLVKEIKMSNAEVSKLISVSDLASGIYYVELTLDGKSYLSKLVIK